MTPGYAGPTSRLSDRLGWLPTVPIRDGLQQTIGWFRARDSVGVG